MEKHPLHYASLELNNSGLCIKITDDILKAFLELTSLDDREKYRLRVAVSEIVTNGYFHGNKQNAQKRMFFSCNVFNNRIEISVEDEGDGFNDDEVEEKYGAAGEYATGGRGLKIVEKVADRVKCGKTDNGRFRVSLLKYVNAEPVEAIGQSIESY